MIATIQRIDAHHANAKQLWQELGEPQYLNASTLARLHAASTLHQEAIAVRHADDTLEFEVALPVLGVAAVLLQSTTRPVE